MNKKSFYVTKAPIKLTEGRQLKLHSESWGIITEYYLESVKICNYKAKTTSAATLRIGDASGQVTCVIKGPCIGVLFGLTAQEWLEVEKMCNYGQQLFYRYFKNGVNNSFQYEQKLFYNFCLTSQKHEVLVTKFRRCPNMRAKFKCDPILEILELSKCDNSILDLYISQLRNSNCDTNLEI